MRTDWLKRAGAFLLWILVLLLLLAGLDQLLVRVPVTSPVPLAVATFYREVRTRLVELAKGVASAPAPMPGSVRCLSRTQLPSVDICHKSFTKNS